MYYGGWGEWRGSYVESVGGFHMTPDPGAVTYLVYSL